MENVCVYTAIFGDYDNLREPIQQTVKCDFVCFTDNPSASGMRSTWQIQSLPLQDPQALSHPRLKAKYPKVLAHKFFGGSGEHGRYRSTIWIDGSVEILNPRFVEELLASLGSCGLSMLIHPERDCIYDEAEFCWNWPLYKNLPLREHTAHYKAQGFPAHSGLMACGVIVRDMTNTVVEEIERQWWEEITQWSYQDQLSPPFLLWKNHHCWDKIDLPLWQNHLFKIHPHKIIDR